MTLKDLQEALRNIQQEFDNFPTIEQNPTEINLSAVRLMRYNAQLGIYRRQQEKTYITKKLTLKFRRSELTLEYFKTKETHGMTVGAQEAQITVDMKQEETDVEMLKQEIDHIKGKQEEIKDYCLAIMGYGREKSLELKFLNQT